MSGQTPSLLQESLHTEQVKRKYSKLEREIKRKLTECFLWDHFSEKAFLWKDVSSAGEFKEDPACRGLSFTKDFEIRILGKDENSKHTMNLANIKEDTTRKTRKIFEVEIIDLIERSVDAEDEAIKTKYINGVKNFIANNQQRTINYLRDNKTYLTFISQYHFLQKSEKKEERIKFNVISQVGKLMNEKFWEKAFVKSVTENGKETIEFSDLCRDYLYVLFYNANAVRKDWGRNLWQVFHDSDYSFITTNEKKDIRKYLKALQYLISRDKHNPYGKRDKEWIKEWAKKTSQYADVLRALTNNQLQLENINYFSPQEEFWKKKDPWFAWDYSTQQIGRIGGWIFNNTIKTHNKFERKELPPFEFSQRNKSLASCVEKVIEGKKLNDIIGFRISMKGVNTDHFEEIKQIGKQWIKEFATSLEAYPEKYLKDWNLKIKNIVIDNKGVLSKDQVQNFISELKTLEVGEIQEREKPEPSFIDVSEREQRMKTYYKEDWKDTEKWKTYKTFYTQFSGNTKRGSNGNYKDFKFNITVWIFDKDGKEIWEKPIEIQFDDINNAEGLANFHIRNIEREVNTQSNLSFSISLSELRRIAEKSLKKMSDRSEDKDEKFSKIDFGEGLIIDISDFYERTPENDDRINKAIIGIINYFLKKGTFFLYYQGNEEANKQDNPEKKIHLTKGLLTTNDLSFDPSNFIRVCSGLEVWNQQYSYLGSKANAFVWIYDAQAEQIRWAKIGELIDRMNLGKKKDPQYIA